MSIYTNGFIVKGWAALLLRLCVLDLDHSIDFEKSIEHSNHSWNSMMDDQRDLGLDTLEW